MRARHRPRVHPPRAERPGHGPPGTVGGAVRLVLTMALVLVPRIFNLTQGAPAAQSAVEPPILGSLCAARSDSAAPDLISEEPP